MTPQTLLAQLADNTRLRAVLLLHAEGELCVCELVWALDLAQPKISRHLASLRQAGLAIDRREGKLVFYRLTPDLPAWVDATLDALARGAGSEAPFVDDARRLAAMPNRRTTCVA